MSNYSPLAQKKFDYIIVGAGIAGVVLASRLHENDTSLSILLIEAGTNPSRHPFVPSPLTAALLLGSELDWNYETLPQQHLQNRRYFAAAGRALGGGSVTNFGIFISSRPPQSHHLLMTLIERTMDPRRHPRLRRLGQYCWRLEVEL